MAERSNRTTLVNRKSFQGVTNIVRFNWHFFLMNAIGLAFLFLILFFVSAWLQIILYIGIILNSILLILPLLISTYVYDFSNLYTLKWLKTEQRKISKIVNINAGFDEVSEKLKLRFPDADLSVLDFYNEKTHTEISVKRARKRYPPFANTHNIKTDKIPIETNNADLILLFMAAHEIRDKDERTIFFKELNRILNTNGELVIVEHLRDTTNFLAYNIGFFHFQPHSIWISTFKKSNLELIEEFKITPFISCFRLKKNGRPY